MLCATVACVLPPPPQDILLAIDYAIQDGVDILSASLGATYTWDSFADPVQIGYLNAGRVWEGQPVPQRSVLEVVVSLLARHRVSIANLGPHKSRESSASRVRQCVC